MTADVVRLFGRPKPDAIKLMIDFGKPALRFYASGKFHHNKLFKTEAEARAEGDRLVREDGLRWLNSSGGAS